MSYPEIYISKHPGTNYFVDVAKLGEAIVLVKASGYVHYYEMEEVLVFMDDYLAKYFDVKTGIFLLEDYADVEGADTKARKKYIEHYRDSDVLWGGILYNMPLLFRISFNIAQRLHMLEKPLFAVNSYERAIALGMEIICQRDSLDIFSNYSGGLSVKKSGLGKSRLSRLTVRANNIAGSMANRVCGLFSRRYSEELLRYIEAIDWQKDGINAPEINYIADKSVRKVFNAVSFIKSEIDDLLKERDASEKVLRESEAQYRQLVEHAKAGILEFDYQANRIISVNDSFLKISGYSKEEIFSMDPLELMTEESRKIYVERLSQRLSGKILSPDSSYEFTTKSGQRIWVLLNSNITYKDGQPRKADIVLIDITPLKKIGNKLNNYQSKLKQLSIQLSKSEETQRRRLASRLHESVSQELFAAQLKINTLEKSLDDPAHNRQLEEIRELIVRSIREIRGVTYDLSPPVLYDLGLKEAVESLVKSIESKYRMAIKATFSGSLENFNDEIKIIIYRVIKEIVQNAIKHARADFINIMIDNTKHHLSVDVIDNGVGFDADSLSEGYYIGDGFGLFDIREKISHLGGHLTINSTPGSGTRIGLSVPLNPA